MKRRRVIALSVAAALLTAGALYVNRRHYFQVRKPLYLRLLRQAPPFSPTHADGLGFSHPADSAEAQRLSKYFGLDTVVSASMTTWEKALALASFVGRAIPHGNQETQPRSETAIDIWEHSLRTERALNCRLHSYLLHDLLLAAGVRGRVTFCLPASTTDNDCHVVNSVWLPELGKWAMVDSDFRFWLSRPGYTTPLGVGELRQRLIAGEDVETHGLPCAPQRMSGSKYLAYMAKNTYWFATDQDNGFTIRRETGTRVCLVPPGYGERRRHYLDGISTSSETAFWEVERQ